METEKEKAIWQVAKKRVEFKRHLATYVIINGMFWLLWYFSDGDVERQAFPWPVWPMFGWGIGLLFSYLNAYVFTKENSVQKEYDKIKDRM